MLPDDAPKPAKVQGVGQPLPVRLPWDKTQVLHSCLYYATLAIPFFCTGLVIATAFAPHEPRIRAHLRFLDN